MLTLYTKVTSIYLAWQKLTFKTHSFGSTSSPPAPAVEGKQRSTSRVKKRNSSSKPAGTLLAGANLEVILLVFIV